MKEQHHYKQTKSFEEQLRDFMKQSDAIQKDINNRNGGDGRRKRKVRHARPNQWKEDI